MMKMYDLEIRELTTGEIQIAQDETAILITKDQAKILAEGLIKIAEGEKK